MNLTFSGGMFSRILFTCCSIKTGIEIVISIIILLKSVSRWRKSYGMKWPLKFRLSEEYSRLIRKIVTIFEQLQNGTKNLSSSQS